MLCAAGHLALKYRSCAGSRSQKHRRGSRQYQLRAAAQDSVSLWSKVVARRRIAHRTNTRSPTHSGRAVAENDEAGVATCPPSDEWPEWWIDRRSGPVDLAITGESPMLEAIGKCRRVRALAPEGQAPRRVLLDIRGPLRVRVFAGRGVADRLTDLAFERGEACAEPGVWPGAQPVAPWAKLVEPGHRNRLAAMAEATHGRKFDTCIAVHLHPEL